MASLWDLISTFHCKDVCPHESCALSVLRGIRNGAIYGAKIRFPHALVMTFLFKRGDPVKMAESIMRATYTHSKNLATFVGIYKFVRCVMCHLRGQNTGMNALVAGAVGGAIVWGKYGPINSQINMYILSRITFGLLHTAMNHGYVKEIDGAFTVYAAVLWAIVMYLFHYQKGTLQPSLINSMKFLYEESDEWPDLDVTSANWWFGDVF